MTTPFCKACSGEWPRSDHFLADCGHTRAYLHEDQFFSGWTILVLKRHATELFHLSIEERAGMIEEVARMAEVLAGEYRAMKVNYELLGNQVPHIHWHLIPRLKDDPAPLDPVWNVVHAPKILAPDELAQVVARLRTQVEKP